MCIHWHLENLVKIFRGFIELRHVTVPKQMVFLKERYAASRKELQQYCYNQDLMKTGGLDSAECQCYLRNVQDLLTEGKTPFERRFGEPFKGPMIPCGAMVEYHPVSARDQSRPHQPGKKVLPGIFLA